MPLLQVAICRLQSSAVHSAGPPFEHCSHAMRRTAIRALLPCSAQDCHLSIAPMQCAGNVPRRRGGHRELLTHVSQGAFELRLRISPLDCLSPHGPAL
jgi:hypothetical protein